MTESQLQTKIIKFLRDRGAYVIKTRPQPGIPVGCPDIIALYAGRWVAIEVKASFDAPYRVGQEATLEHLRQLNPGLVFRAYPENWSGIQPLLIALFFK